MSPGWTKIAQSISKRDQDGSKMRQKRAKETPMSAQGRPNARPRRPNGFPEAPKIVQNRCQNVSGIDDQLRQRFLLLFHQIFTKKIEDFCCFFLDFFACNSSSNGKKALIKRIENHRFSLGFLRFLLIHDESKSIENNKKMVANAHRIGI